MLEYNKKKIQHIEKKWNLRWEETQINKVEIDLNKPKYYVLDMFPYPSGAGLHVGHPLGYIASDIIARYKRLKGFNVLHPMGFDAFGLPAEQYALEQGIHPTESIKKNIENFKKQLNLFGFFYDWSREIKTCDPNYYKWTQWIFLQFFKSWFNRKKQKAEPLTTLIHLFENEGNVNHPCPNIKYTIRKKHSFSGPEWKQFTQDEQLDVLMQYRLAYIAHTDVNWCEALGTVLANDEVINGMSYRGGHPVVKRKMRQWNLRITEYADRLLKGLELVDFSPSMKEIQKNWIGQSSGAIITFTLTSPQEEQLDLPVFTTRPDTLFGVDFMVLAPEHELIQKITTPEQQADVDNYLKYAEQRTEVDRMAETKKITGCFTGSYATNPINEKVVPIWISEYVLMGYGTGAIMAVPCGDERDHQFAKHFNLPITNILGAKYNGQEANPTQDAILKNSGFASGLPMREAIDQIVVELEKKGQGKKQINYKMRDAGWSRQRYWGEPFPIYFKNNVPFALDEDQLPLLLPPISDFTPHETGQGPLARLSDWINAEPEKRRDSNTMPTHAGAAWYFLRYMDPTNDKYFAERPALDYWNQVDLYIGGAEHAVAHLLYARLWVKVLHDLGYINFDEPFKKLINQGKIMGDSRFVYRIRETNCYVSGSLKDKYDTDPLRVDICLVRGVELDTEAFRAWRKDFTTADFILDNGKYFCGTAIEKMSKSYFNVVSPDDIVAQYGADTLRLYEMFLGPIEQSKPWNTHGIEGVYKFLRRVWMLVYSPSGEMVLSDDPPVLEEKKILHKSIKKISSDLERYSFNTCVSEFMICVNELIRLRCHKREIIEPFLIMLAPFAPYITEELWEVLDHDQSIHIQNFPSWDEHYLVETKFEYPISINGRVRSKINLSLDLSVKEIEKTVLSSKEISKWLQKNEVKKVIVVPGKIVNVVV